jgi:uncharacterized membrane protein YuzA (DUF378 family)
VAIMLHAYAPGLGARLLPTSAVAALCATGLAWIAIQAFTGYLRAYREEPLLAVTSVGVVVAMIATAIAAQRGAVAATVVYAVVVVCGVLPLVGLDFAVERARRVQRDAEPSASA